MNYFLLVFLHKINLKRNGTGIALSELRAKRDKRILVSPNINSWVYITLVLALPNDDLILHAFAYSSFPNSLAIRIEEQTMNNEQRIKQNFLIQLKKHLKYFRNCMEITSFYTYEFLSGTRNSKRSVNKWQISLDAGDLQQAGLRTTSSR